MTKPPLSKSLILLSAVTTLLLSGGTGCAKSGVHMADPSTYKSTGVNYTDVTGNGGFPGDTDFKCPTGATIKTMGGADPYTICIGQTTGFEISLHGSPTHGKSKVCVFPSDAINAKEVYAASNSYGQALDQCLDMSSGYGTLTFSGARFNGAFVVESNDESNMAWCLQNGNTSACPAFYYERWGAYDTGVAASH